MRERNARLPSQGKHDFGDGEKDKTVLNSSFFTNFSLTSPHSEDLCLLPLWFSFSCKLAAIGFARNKGDRPVPACRGVVDRSLSFHLSTYRPPALSPEECRNVC